MSLQLYMDVHVPRGIVDALRARSVSVLTAQEDGYAEVDDAMLLARATALNRVLFTGLSWQRAGISFAGLVYAHQLRVTIGRCVQDLALMAEANVPEDLANRVEHLPL